MLSDVFINLEILNTPLILVIMLLQDNNIFKTLTSGIMDSLTGFQDNLLYFLEFWTCHNEQQYLKIIHIFINTQQIFMFNVSI